MTYRCYSNREYLSGESKIIFQIVHTSYEKKCWKVCWHAWELYTASAVEVTQNSPISQHALAFGHLLTGTSLLKISTIHLSFQHPVYVFRFSWWLLKTCWTFGVPHQVTVECSVLTSSGGHIQLNHIQSSWRWGQHGPSRCGNIQSLHSAETQKTSIAFLLLMSVKFILNI